MDEFEKMAIAQLKVILLLSLVLLGNVIQIHAYEYC